MTQEEFQNLVIGELKELKNKADSIERRLEAVERKQGSLRNKVHDLERKVEEINKAAVSIEKKLDDNLSVIDNFRDVVQHDKINDIVANLAGFKHE